MQSKLHLRLHVCLRVYVCMYVCVRDYLAMIWRCFIHWEVFSIQFGAKLGWMHTENPKRTGEFQRGQCTLTHRKTWRAFEINANFSAARVRLTSPLFFNPVLSFPTAFPALWPPLLRPIADFYDSARGKIRLSLRSVSKRLRTERDTISSLCFLIKVTRRRLDYYNNTGTSSSLELITLASK